MIGELTRQCKCPLLAWNRPGGGRTRARGGAGLLETLQAWRLRIRNCCARHQCSQLRASPGENRQELFTLYVPQKTSYLGHRLPATSDAWWKRPKCFQTLLNVSWDTKSLPIENRYPVSTSFLYISVYPSIFFLVKNIREYTQVFTILLFLTQKVACATHNHLHLVLCT